MYKIGVQAIACVHSQRCSTHWGSLCTVWGGVCVAHCTRGRDVNDDDVHALGIL